MNEFRQDPVSQHWVIISTDRDDRPNQFAMSSDLRSDSEDSGANDCPFCAHQMNTPPIVARYGLDDQHQPWQVCVVPNLFPVLHGEVAPTATTQIHHGQPARGRHEVVIESPTHQLRTGELTQVQFAYLLQAYRDRMQAFAKMQGIRCALPIKNSGQLAGASLRHTHSQIFGLPVVPEQIQRELAGCADYLSRHQRCVFCDLMHAASNSPSRIVAESDNFVAWCPLASRFAYEVWLAPRQHQDRFECVGNGDLAELGQLLRQILRKLETNSQTASFNYLLHSKPFDSNPQDHYHWHIEILPRVAKQAGFEWGTGIHINTVEPIKAASQLRINR